jgi:predicted nucleotidyltransferase
MLENIEAQPQWIEWRAAPLNQRAALARNIAKQFHPDKWDTFNPTCDVDHAGACADWRQGDQLKCHYFALHSTLHRLHISKEGLTRAQGIGRTPFQCG